MQNLSQLVNESLARNGVQTDIDHRRLQWSQWFRCESSFSSLLVPSKPGIFALAEEVISPGQTGATEGKRMLALFQISQTEDLGMALGRMFLPGNMLRDRMESGRCFARYTIMEDAAQRQSALAALQQWLASSTETATAA